MTKQLRDWTRHLSSLQDEGEWTMLLSFSLSTRQLLEQIQTCSIPKDGRDTTDSMGHGADSRSSVEEVYPIPERMRRRLGGGVVRKNQVGERIFSF